MKVAQLSEGLVQKIEQLLLTVNIYINITHRNNFISTEYPRYYSTVMHADYMSWSWSSRGLRRVFLTWVIRILKKKKKKTAVGHSAVIRKP